MKRDPIQPLIQAGVYILLCYAPVFLFGRVFFFLFQEFAGAIIGILTFSLLGNFLCLRIFEGVGLEHLGMPLNRPALRNSFTGAILGFASAAVVVLIPLLTNQTHESVPPGAVVSWGQQLFVPFMMIAGAAGEEILFRGFGFQIFLRAYGPVASVLSFGLLFGLMHGSNPHASWFGIANTAAFGILFGYAFLRSHDIWLPFGLHFGWNMTLLLFGAPISGLTMRITSYLIVPTGSELLSGGEYGPEASALTTVVLLLLAVAVWKVHVIRQHAYLVDEPGRDA